MRRGGNRDDAAEPRRRAGEVGERASGLRRSAGKESASVFFLETRAAAVSGWCEQNFWVPHKWRSRILDGPFNGASSRLAVFEGPFESARRDILLEHRSTYRRSQRSSKAGLKLEILVSMLL